MHAESKCRNSAGSKPAQAIRQERFEFKLRSLDFGLCNWKILGLRLKAVAAAIDLVKHDTALHTGPSVHYIIAS
ncbi:MAG: hypothetical protein C0507_14390 [Cyanobacteria bacterium PR.3.49]|nr:hypothetical protein [Cyanobacteria bacterium PR.3.49]